MLRAPNVLETRPKLPPAQLPATVLRLTRLNRLNTQDDPAAQAARHREQGLLYAKQGSRQAALGHFHSALELDPGDKISQPD